MKTLREVLLKRHRNANARLDAIRESVVTNLSDHGARNTEHVGALSTLYDQLILPARRIWIGLAATWLFILVTNLSFHAGSSRVVAASSTRSPDVLREVREQQQLMAELVEGRRPKTVEANKPTAPQPRSDLRNEMLNAKNV